jgi:hypothetical protein
MASQLNLKDHDLFGHVAAEDEEEAIFTSYQVARPELSRLSSDKVADNVVIISAFRGEGKSALLRIASKQLQSSGKVFLARTTATSLSVDKTSPDVAVLTRLWKSAIYNYVAKQVGSKIGFAWQDDSIGLVEFAQNEGFKSKPWLIGLFDRIKLQIPGLPEVKKVQDFSPQAAEERIKRWAGDNEAFWLFVDDVDANFKDTKESRAKLMAYFQALREVRNEAPSIKIRTTARPNILAILRSEFADAAKLNDYIVDLNWTEEQIRDLLATRIRAYFVRHGIDPKEQAPRRLIGICFRDPMRWGGDNKAPHVVLNTFSRSRPRWLVEICKAASNEAADRSLIELGDITRSMAAVGKTRQLDLAVEYEPQCKQIGQILDVFVGEDEEYSTPDLFGLLQRKLLDNFKPEIVGAGGVGITPQVVTRLLFEIGFLTARKKAPHGYTHQSFADDVNLIRPTGAIQDSVRWEIHPIFRQSLSIRDAEGKLISRPRSH